MLDGLHSRSRLQKLMALVIGILFGLFLQRGGAADYGVITAQLMLRDFTVLRIMITAVVVGMAGVFGLRAAGLARLHPKSGSLGSTIPGGILFGGGFALLGYCPGTLAAASGSGSLDALLAGIPGMLLGAWLFAAAYPKLNGRFLKRGNFGDVSLADFLGIPFSVLVPLTILFLAGTLYLIRDL